MMRNVPCVLPLAALVAATSACSRAGFGVPPEPVTVQPVYPHNANWNDYVQNADPSRDAFHQNDVACTGAETGGYAACIHGGEERACVLSDATSCTGLRIADDLGAFTWTCDDHNGTGPVTFYSIGLAPGKGLADLLTAGAFKPNAVTIYRGKRRLARSPPRVWDWTNPIVPLPDNATGPVATLDVPGAIYTLARSRGSNGYNINADHVAVVVLGGAVLAYGGSSQNNCSATSETASPTLKCQIAAGSQKFIWVEGRLDAAGSADENLRLSGVEFSRVQNLVAQDAAEDGVVLVNASKNNQLDHVTIASNGQDGLSVEQANNDYNTFANFFITNAGNNGIDTQTSGTGDYNVYRNITIVGCRNLDNNDSFYIGTEHNLLDNIFVAGGQTGGLAMGGSDNTVVNGVFSNNGRAGVVDGWANNNTFVNILAVNNGKAGVEITDAAYDETYSNITAANNGSYGLGVLTATQWPPHGNTINQLVAVNNDIDLDVSGSSNLFSQVYAGNSSTANVRVTTNGQRFTQNLVVSNATGNCDVRGTTTSGLINGTCTNSGADGSSTYSGQPSDAVLHTGRGSATSFVGKIKFDDTTNASDTNGSQSAVAITDWTHFDNFFRAWGLDGSAFPNADQRGVCAAATCRIWDWRLRADDTTLRDFNGALPADGDCPASVNGNRAITDQQTPSNTFLVNAVEIIGDGIGDDDGLCESNEACIYSPNLGVYQGEGIPRAATCHFVDGTVKGVTMYVLPINGR